MTAYLLAALDMAGTTVDEGGLVYSAIEAAVAEAVGGPVPAGLRCRPAMPNRWRTRS